MVRTVSSALVAGSVVASLLVVVPGPPADAAGGGSGSISLTSLTTPAAESFDMLASSGATNNLSLPGWHLDETGGSGANNGQYAAGTGADTSGDVYSFGPAGSPERAFGSLLSVSLTPVIGAAFVNDTGTTIGSLAVAYTGEQWRLGQNGEGRFADRLDFQLSTDATSLTTGLWVDYDSLDFSSPVAAGTVGTLDGNAAPNRPS